jgi:periplasmic copper chaperone A
MRAIALAVTIMAPIFAVAAGAHEFKLGPIEIDHPWSRATPKGATVASGYFKIKNTGAASDRLVGGSSEAGSRFEIHEMTMDGGVMRMRPVGKGLEIKPGQTVELKPGSFHVMILGLKKPLQQGNRFKGTLVFEKAGSVDVEYVVEAMGGSSGEHRH